MTKLAKLFICLIIGYILGSFSPAAILGKIKKTDLRKAGTKNLGATNVMHVFGKARGAAVLVLDMAKAFLAVKLASVIMPEAVFSGIAAGCASVFGHVFPFYMRFKGGKGLAPFAGMVLAVDPVLFVFLFVVSITLMLILNYSYAIPFSAGLLFPVLSVGRCDSGIYLLFALIASCLVIIKHVPNFIKALHKEDVMVREYIKGMFK